MEQQYNTEQMEKIATKQLTGSPGLSIVGPDGKPWTLEAINNWWGAQIRVIDPVPHPDAPYIVRPHELRVAEGPCVQIVRVIDAAGNPVEGAAVCRWWADAPYLPPLTPSCHATYIYDRAVVGETNAGGDVGFGMGGGDMPGSSAVWVANCAAPSGGVVGLGWKPGTNHAAFVVTFQVVPASVPPVVPPGDCPVEELLAQADAVEAQTGVIVIAAENVSLAAEALRQAAGAIRSSLGK